MAKTANQRSKEARKRNREEGMVPKHIWVYPEDWEEIKAFIDFKTDQTEKNQNSC